MTDTRGGAGVETAWLGLLTDYLGSVGLAPPHLNPWDTWPGALVARHRPIIEAAIRAEMQGEDDNAESLAIR